MPVQTIKTGAFTMANTPAPAITKSLPVSAYLNTTVNFTLTGTGFQQPDTNGQAMTVVDFTNTTGKYLNTTLLAVNQTTIIGYVRFDPNLPTSTVKPWSINVTTADGGRNKAGFAFTVSAWPVPAVTKSVPVYHSSG